MHSIYMRISKTNSISLSTGLLDRRSFVSIVTSRLLIQIIALRNVWALASIAWAYTHKPPSFSFCYAEHSSSSMFAGTFRCAHKRQIVYIRRLHIIHNSKAKLSKHGIQREQYVAKVVFNSYDHLPLTLPAVWMCLNSIHWHFRLHVEKMSFCIPWANPLCGTTIAIAIDWWRKIEGVRGLTKKISYAVNCFSVPRLFGFSIGIIFCLLMNIWIEFRE